MLVVSEWLERGYTEMRMDLWKFMFLRVEFEKWNLDTWMICTRSFVFRSILVSRNSQVLRASFPSLKSVKCTLLDSVGII